MTTVIVFLTLLAIVLFIGARKKSKKFAIGKSLSEVQSTNEEPTVITGVLDRSDGIFDVFVAGLAHHCTVGDVGVFHGCIYNEKSNPVDKNAMAIWSDNKPGIIGYVPSAILSEYRDWSEGRKCSCIGVLFWNGDCLRGRVRAYAKGIDSTATRDDMDKYAMIVREHFGWVTPNLS